MKDDIIDIETNATVTPMTIPALGTPSSDSLAMTMLERKRLCMKTTISYRQASHVLEGGQGKVKTTLKASYEMR